MSKFLTIGIACAVLLGALVAVASYRYLLPGWPAAPAAIAANIFAQPWLPLHAALGATALLVAPIQFLPNLRLTRPNLHRVVGRSYVLCCFASGLAGLILAWGGTAGPVATAGFATLAVTWVIVTARGLVLALHGRGAEHRRWMVRSFALTFSAVTLRLYLPLPPLLGIDFVEGYRAISFLCWVPNLLAAELYLRRGSNPGQNHRSLRRAGV